MYDVQVPYYEQWRYPNGEEKMNRREVTSGAEKIRSSYGRRSISEPVECEEQERGTG